MEVTTDNTVRVARAAEFINGYLAKYDPDEDGTTAAIDLIADIFHYLHVMGPDVPRIVMEIAFDHYTFEQGEADSV